MWERFHDPSDQHPEDQLQVDFGGNSSWAHLVSDSDGTQMTVFQVISFNLNVITDSTNSMSG